MKKSTQFAKTGEVERKWVLIDADGMTLGRLATQAAMILRGKNKPQYTPNADTGVKNGDVIMFLIHGFTFGTYFCYLIKYQPTTQCFVDFFVQL